MKKSMKIALVCVSSVVVILLGTFFVIYSGLLVRPTARTSNNRVEVPYFNLIEWQFARELEILAEYNSTVYTFDEPFIIIDPYLMNPLSALVMFEVIKPADIEVTIVGDCYFSTFTYIKTVLGTHVEIPILGLYAGRENRIIIRILYTDGSYETNELTVTTEPLPTDFQILTLVSSVPERMEPGVTLFIACFEQTYTALVDANAQVRGFLSNKRMAHGTNIILLENGNLLATGDEYKQIPYHMTSLWEFNWLGKIFKEYIIPHAVHHGIQEKPNGNILAVSNNKNMFQSGTREDVMIIIDRATGAVIREYDFRYILDETRAPFHHFHPEIINSNSSRDNSLTAFSKS
jgi:arylsulfate sulfotransferase